MSTSESNNKRLSGAYSNTCTVVLLLVSLDGSFNLQIQYVQQEVQAHGVLLGQTCSTNNWQYIVFRE